MIRVTATIMLVLCFCATSRAQSRVVGGTNVAEGTYPWMASVGFPSDGDTDIFFNQFCGGMLVSPNYVLTAGHCVVSSLPSSLEVVVGVTDLSNVPSTARRRNVTEIIIHPDFRETEDAVFFDIALLKLDAPITGVTPIPIATAPTTTVATAVRAIGWGDTTDDEFTVDFPTVLQQVALETVSLSRLQSDISNSLSLQHLGAFGINRDTCQGDSGGPLFTESPLSLVGITSFGIGCADDTPGVYADVGYFSDYINSIIGVTPVLGDVNMDRGVNFADIPPFIVLLTSGTYQFEADIDGDVDVDFLDIPPFIELLLRQ